MTGKSAPIAEAWIQLTPTLDGATRKIEKELGGVGTTAGKTAGKTYGGGLLSGVKSIAGPLAALGGGALALDFGKDSLSAASDLGESLNALDVVFGDVSGEIAGLGEAAAQNVGLSNLDFNNLAVQFSGFAKNIAGEGGDVVGTLDDLTGRASDFASVMNLDVAEAAGLFQSGLAGESEPLRRFSIDLSAAAVDAYAYANGIAEGGEQLTEAEKVQARYGLLMQETAQTQGDFANTSDSLANSTRILSSEWENFKADAGEALLPLATAGVNWLTEDVVPALQDVHGFITEDVAPAVSELWDQITNPPEGGSIDTFTSQYEESALNIVEDITGPGGLVDAFGELGTASSDFAQTITGTDGTAEALGTLAEWSLKPLEFQVNNLTGFVGLLTDGIGLANTAWETLSEYVDDSNWVTTSPTTLWAADKLSGLGSSPGKRILDPSTVSGFPASAPSNPLGINQGTTININNLNATDTADIVRQAQQSARRNSLSGSRGIDPRLTR